MITPRAKPSALFCRQPSTDLFVHEHREAKLGGFIANLAAMDDLIDFAPIAVQVNTACPRPDRSKGGRPPYPIEIMVWLMFIQALYKLSDERMSSQRFCRLEGALHIPDERTLWSFKQRLSGMKTLPRL